MKKCPRCNSVSSDTENSCRVCGGSLSGAASESLELLVHKEPDARPKKKLNRGGLVLITLALAMTGVGAFLLVLLNGLGVILLVGGLVMILYFAGGVGIGMGGTRGSSKVSMQRAEDKRIEEELKRKRGEED